MKNLIFFLLVLLPATCIGQGTWNTRQDFDQGIQIVGGVTVSNVYISAGDTMITIAGKDFILSDIRLKLNIADTSVMLATYIDRSDTATMLLTYIDRSDTAAMLTPYLLSADIAGKLDIADTAAMLVPYINRADTSAMLVPYINRSDTAAMLTPYALLSEAGSAYNSGSGITIDGSNNIDLDGALDAPATITGTEVNDLSINFSDAGDRSAKFQFKAADGLSIRAYTGDDYTGDSSILAVDSTIVTIAQYDGAAVKSIVIDTNSFVITDTDNGKGPVFAADYSTVTTARSITDKEWQGTHLGYQILNSSVYSPTPSEHGDLITWDSLNLEYVATDVVPVAQAAGLVIEAFDTIIFSLTTVDTIVILPVGAVIWDIQVYLNTAFDGSGTNLLDVGIDGDGDKYINDFDLENPAATFYGLGAIPDRMAATTEIIFQYTDSGADAAAGLAFIYVKYTIPAKLY